MLAMIIVGVIETIGLMVAVWYIHYQRRQVLAAQQVIANKPRGTVIVKNTAHPPASAGTTARPQTVVAVKVNERSEGLISKKGAVHGPGVQTHEVQAREVQSSQGLAPDEQGSLNQGSPGEHTEQKADNLKFYLPLPARDGEFRDDQKKPDYQVGNSLYQLKLTGNDTGKLSIYADEFVWKLLIRNRESLILPVADELNAFTASVSSIVVEEGNEAELHLENGRWKVVKKMKVKYR